MKGEEKIFQQSDIEADELPFCLVCQTDFVVGQTVIQVIAEEGDLPQMSPGETTDLGMVCDWDCFVTKKDGCE